MLLVPVCRFKESSPMQPSPLIKQATPRLLRKTVRICESIHTTALIPSIRSQAAWKHPSCIFQPAVAHDLEIVIPMLGQADVHFAIRSGGHMPAPGFANIDNGVLIDMSKLTTL